MAKMDFSKTLFRCHALGKLMTNERNKETMGDTCKTYLKELRVSLKYGREKKLDNKYIRKGLAVEEDAITLYSRVRKKYLRKNEQRLSNHYITGLPDIFIGPDDNIFHAEEIPDTKASWDIFTFNANDPLKVNTDYKWQIQGYCALTGAKFGTVVYCLINTPEIIFNDEMRKLSWKMGALTEESPEYLEAVREFKKEHIFDDIPLEERIIEQRVNRNEEDIKKIYRRCEEAREYLNYLEDGFEEARRKKAA